MSIKYYVHAHACIVIVYCSAVFVMLYVLSSSVTIVSVFTFRCRQVVVQADPDLVALHCQEVGGKDFEICMPKVKVFIR